MRVTMLLCDAAQEVGGKLFVLGGGWTHLLRPGTPVSMAIAVVVAIPWDQANQRLAIGVSLVTDDGVPVNISGNSVRATGEIEVGRPPGLKPGSEINAPLAFSFIGVALAPGGYVWELTIGGDVLDRTPFWVVEP